MLGCDFSASVPVSYFIAGSWHQRITPRRSPPLNLRGAGIPTPDSYQVGRYVKSCDFLVQARFAFRVSCRTRLQIGSHVPFPSTASMSEKCSKFNQPFKAGFPGFPGMEFEKSIQIIRRGRSRKQIIVLPYCPKAWEK